MYCQPGQYAAQAESWAASSTNKTRLSKGFVKARRWRLSSEIADTRAQQKFVWQQLCLKITVSEQPYHIGKHFSHLKYLFQQVKTWKLPFCSAFPRSEGSFGLHQCQWSQNLQRIPAARSSIIKSQLVSKHLCIDVPFCSYNAYNVVYIYDISRTLTFEFFWDFPTHSFAWQFTYEKESRASYSALHQG